MLFFKLLSHTLGFSAEMFPVLDQNWFGKKNKTSQKLSDLPRLESSVIKSH